MEAFLQQYGLAAVYGALVGAACGLPVPEDLTLLLAGVLVGRDHAVAWQAALVGYAGLLTADSLAWFYGSKVGLSPTGFFARLVGPEDVARIDRFYRRFGAWAIVIARLVPGLRFPAFFFAGASGVSYRRFLGIDAAIAWAPVALLLSLGAHFANDFERLAGHLESVQTAGSGLIALIVIFVAYRIVQRRRARAA